MVGHKAVCENVDIVIQSLALIETGAWSRASCGEDAINGVYESLEMVRGIEYRTFINAAVIDMVILVILKNEFTHDFLCY